MSKPLTILCDMDSILCDFYFGVLEAYELETGDKPHPAVLNDWNAKLPNGKDCHDYFKKKGFFENLKPVPGALEFLRRAMQEGHDVMICSTGTLEHAPGEKYRWLSHHLPELDRKHVHFTGRKEMVYGDFLIDDHAKNTGPWKLAHPKGTAIGIQYPYNVNEFKAFDHLVASYVDFPFAWQQISKIVFGEGFYAR